MIKVNKSLSVLRKIQNHHDIQGFEMFKLAAILVNGGGFLEILMRIFSSSGRTKLKSTFLNFTVKWEVYEFPAVAH